MMIRRTRAACLAALTLGVGMIAACANSDFAGGIASSKKKEAKEKDESDELDDSDDDGVDPDLDTNSTSGGDGKLESDFDEGVSGVGLDEDESAIFADEGLECEKGRAGFVGKVYRLPPETPSLPNFATLTPVGQVEAPQLDVPPRSWTQGFPGVPDLVEWFAIEFIAALDVPADGTYAFRTHSDDGSRLYIDDVLVVNNDGTHAPDSMGGTADLKAGKRKIKVEWFQGPREEIALQVYWTPPNGGEQIIPVSVLTHAKDCNLADLGTFQ